MSPGTTLVLQAWMLAGLARSATLDQDGRGIESYFRDCRTNSSDFDPCVQRGLNMARRFFKTGLPEYGVLPFDPFLAEQVVLRRGGPAVRGRLTLREVQERGWTQSVVTSFKSDLATRTIKYSQWFPEKFLEGRYEVDGKVLRYPMSNKGFFNLTLYNYTQTTTIRRPEEGPMSVKVTALRSADMKIHASNLLRGRPVMEGILDQIINFSWQPWFEVLKPAIDEMVSSAFTDIFNKDFAEFPFQAVFPA
ncbi:uncharacterized protein LOC134532401 [Bacillus rossius redtenbacheri]|uniref:uncharacterized protein LOC134532401 n=1 Tax=Bacillus rossius redtenbacheri TaxID=93214 RepID=UPI002FDE87AC